LLQMATRPRAKVLDDPDVPATLSNPMDDTA
jgi:hypothetical protein